MKPEYGEVIFNDFKEKYNNPNNAILKLNKTLSDLDESNAIADQGSTIINYNCIAYKYITDVITDNYDVIDKNKNISSRSIDYKKMLPVELYYYVAIISSDINALSEFEEFYQSLYIEPQKYSIELPLDTKEKIHYSFSIIEHKRGNYSKMNPTNCANKPLYISQFCIKGENCISFTEKYSAAQLELVEGTKDEVIERLSALEDIKKLLIQNDSSDPRINDVESAWNELNKLIDCTQGITTYHDLYETMLNNKCTPEEAIDIIKKEQAKQIEKERLEKEREAKKAEEIKRKKENEEKLKQAKINKANTQFVKNGDPILNKYTDTIAEHIKNTLSEFGNITIYAGSNYMDFYRNKTLNTLKFPCIVIEDLSNFLLDINRHINMLQDGSMVYRYHDFIESLPINYNIKLTTYINDEALHKDIVKKIIDTYSNQVNVYVDDPVYQGEKNVINLLIENVQNDVSKYEKSNELIYTSQFTFKKTQSVYYAKEYGYDEIENNPRLQFRLLQRAEYFLCCFSQIKNKSLSELENKYYELVMNKFSLFGFLDSANFKQLKQQIKYKRPIDRELFDTELKIVTCVYPLYDKMMSGMSYEQIRNELNQKADIYACKWASLCDTLNLPENVLPSVIKPFDNHNFNAKSKEGLVFCINHMFKNPDATLNEAISEFRSYLMKEYKAWQKKERERKAELQAQQEYASYDYDYDNDDNSYSNNESGGFIKSILSTAVGTYGVKKSIDNQTRYMKEQAEKDRIERERAEYQRKHEASLKSQREYNAVVAANKERRRKGLPELPLPPRTWY